MPKLKSLAAAVVALALVGVGSTAAAQSFSNAPSGNSISPFGSPDTQTYGEVFSAHVSGTLDSFSLYLDDAIGGTLFGGIGVWNGNGISDVLYQSDAVAADHGGAYTFTPGIDVLEGQTLIAYLTTFGADSSGQGTTRMPLATDGPSGFLYFAFNNGAPDATTWDNFLGNGYDARLDLTYSAGNAVPEPGAWALMILGFGAVGALARRRREAAAA
jgi:hypothetical protein